MSRNGGKVTRQRRRPDNWRDKKRRGRVVPQPWRLGLGDRDHELGPGPGLALESLRPSQQAPRHSLLSTRDVGPRLGGTAVGWVAVLIDTCVHAIMPSPHQSVSFLSHPNADDWTTPSSPTHSGPEDPDSETQSSNTITRPRPTTSPVISLSSCPITLAQPNHQRGLRRPIMRPPT
jgi:hypothetical protein